MGVVVVTRRLRVWGLLGALSTLTITYAAVLPEDRADLLYHYYSGGGVTISGPSLLVRKQVGQNFSLVANQYMDYITSASIDVMSYASPYKEQRTQQSLGVDYLNGKTTMTANYTSSIESDYKAGTTSFGVTQSMFGDLTTVTLGYSRGDDIVGQSTDPTFAKPVTRQNFQLGMSQIFTKSFLMNFDLETITDEGYLHNPYRNVRYSDGGTGYTLQSEVYPNTHISNTVAVRGKYYLPYRAAAEAEVRGYGDSWGVNAVSGMVGYTQPAWDDWILEFKYRLYNQGQASFYSDLFPYKDAQNFLARDKELSAYSYNMITAMASYEFAKGGWSFINKGSVNLSLSHFQFDYRDFRDITVKGYTAGNEPLYKFSSNVMQFFLSIWY